MDIDDAGEHLMSPVAAVQWSTTHAHSSPLMVDVWAIAVQVPLVASAAEDLVGDRGM